MTKVIVIGGRGFVGQKVIESLKTDRRFEVYLASRTPQNDLEIRCDLLDKSTYHNLTNHYVIINCSDNFKASPIPLAKFCLEEGLTLIETTADPTVMDEILNLPHSEAYSGTVIAGMGIFPGVSNIMASKLKSSWSDLNKIQIVIHVSPFSQAGASTCRLMAVHFTYESLILSHGKRQFVDTLKPHVIKKGDSSIRGLSLFFPEVTMLSKSANIPNIETYLATRPKILGYILGLMRRILTVKILVPVNAFFLLILRSTLLKKMSSKIKIECLGSNESGESKTITLSSVDGMDSLAKAIHASLNLIEKEQPKKGLLLPDQAFSWESFMKEFQSLRPEDKIDI